MGCCNSTKCSPRASNRCGTSVTKIIRDCNLAAAPHSLTLRSRTETFFFDLCMSFGSCTPRPICLVDYLDPRLQLCERADGCPDVALYVVEGGCNRCVAQGEGAVLDWDGACRKLTLKFSPCLQVDGRTFILRLRVRPRTKESTLAAEVINRCTLHTGNTQITSNAVMVRIPGACPPCMQPPGCNCQCSRCRQSNCW